MSGGPEAVVVPRDLYYHEAAYVNALEAKVLELTAPLRLNDHDWSSEDVVAHRREIIALRDWVLEQADFHGAITLSLTIGLLDALAKRLPVATPEAPEQGVESRAISDIAAERKRQIEAEGWTPEHDDLYRTREMAFAAASYAVRDTRYWPWSLDWWKPTSQRRDLIKAGALIAAEIDRLDRAAAPEKEKSKEASSIPVSTREWDPDLDWGLE